MHRNEKNAVAQGGFGSLVPWGYSMKLLGSPLRGLIVNSGMLGPDHRKWLIQTVFWSIAAKVALPYLDQDQTMFCPATTLVRQIWESFWDQCIIGSHHLLCSDPEKVSRGREGAKKSSCNEQRSNTQVKIRYNMVWRHWSPYILYFRREKAEVSKANSKIVIYRLNATPQCMFLEGTGPQP